jgi:hypothetical protein
MSCVFFYIDESYDDKKFCLSAIGIRHRYWRDCFDLVKAHRQHLKSQYGLHLSSEIHSMELLRGSGKISSRDVTKWERSKIFQSCLSLVGRLPNAFIINVCLDVPGHRDPQMVAWDRLINRIERTMESQQNTELRRRQELLSKLDGKIDPTDLAAISQRLLSFRSRATIFSDEGREREITSAFRRMHAFNLVPSQFGRWHDGSRSQNLPTQHLMEDPIFKPSHRSYFNQLADCVAYALLKREVPPTKRVLIYGMHKRQETRLG